MYEYIIGPLIMLSPCILMFTCWYLFEHCDRIYSYKCEYEIIEHENI